MRNDALLRENKAAKVLDVSRDWLKKRRMHKQPPRFVKISNKSIRYRLTDLEEFVRSRTIEPEHREAVTA